MAALDDAIRELGLEGDTSSQSSNVDRVLREMGMDRQIPQVAPQPEPGTLRQLAGAGLRGLSNIGNTIMEVEARAIDKMFPSLGLSRPETLAAATTGPSSVTGAISRASERVAPYAGKEASARRQLEEFVGSGGTYLVPGVGQVGIVAEMAKALQSEQPSDALVQAVGILVGGRLGSSIEGYLLRRLGPQAGVVWRKAAQMAAHATGFAGATAGTEAVTQGHVSPISVAGGGILGAASGAASRTPRAQEPVVETPVRENIPEPPRVVESPEAFEAKIASEREAQIRELRRGFGRSREVPETGIRRMIEESDLRRDQARAAEERSLLSRRPERIPGHSTEAQAREQATIAAREAARVAQEQSALEFLGTGGGREGAEAIAETARIARERPGIGGAILRHGEMRLRGEGERGSVPAGQIAQGIFRSGFTPGQEMGPTPKAREAAERVLRVQDIRQALAGDWITRFEDAIRPLTKADKSWIAQNFKTQYEGGGIEWPNQRVADFATTWRQISGDVAKRGTDAGVLIGVRDNYHPDILTPAAREAIQRRSGPIFDSIVEAVSRQRMEEGGRPLSPEDIGIVKQELNSYYARGTAQSRMGHLERPRHLNLPESIEVNGERVQLLDTSPESLRNYIERSADRISFVEEFAPSPEVKSRLTSIRRELRSLSGRDPETRARRMELVEEAQGILDDYYSEPSSPQRTTARVGQNRVTTGSIGADIYNQIMSEGGRDRADAFNEIWKGLQGIGLEEGRPMPRETVPERIAGGLIDATGIAGSIVRTGMLSLNSITQVLGGIPVIAQDVPLKNFVGGLRSWASEIGTDRSGRGARQANVVRDAIFSGMEDTFDLSRREHQVGEILQWGRTNRLINNIAYHATNNTLADFANLAKAGRLTEFERTMARDAFKFGPEMMANFERGEITRDMANRAVREVVGNANAYGRDPLRSSAFTRTGWFREFFRFTTFIQQRFKDTIQKGRWFKQGASMLDRDPVAGARLMTPLVKTMIINVLANEAIQRAREGLEGREPEEFTPTQAVIDVAQSGMFGIPGQIATSVAYSILRPHGTRGILSPAGYQQVVDWAKFIGSRVMSDGRINDEELRRLLRNSAPILNAMRVPGALVDAGVIERHYAQGTPEARIQRQMKNREPEARLERMRRKYGEESNAPQ